MKLDNKTKLEILRILKGTRNGFYYGARVRFFHSLVIMILFGRGSFWRKVKKILKQTFYHASRLALFVFCFKGSKYLIQHFTKSKKSWIWFVSGFIGGFTFLLTGSPNNPINQQLILYLLSRNITGILKMIENKLKCSDLNFFPLLATLSWGMVMYLFSTDKSALQKSLSSSMTFLYVDSDNWHSWKDFVPFYIPEIF